MLNETVLDNVPLPTTICCCGKEVIGYTICSTCADRIRMGETATKIWQEYLANNSAKHPEIEDCYGDTIPF